MEQDIRVAANDPGVSLHPGFIAYTSDRGGRYDIWIYNPQMGANVQLTQGLGETFTKPYWSPDRTKIAFVRMNRIIYIVSTVNGSVSQIDQLEEGNLFLDWSPDSQWLAYVKHDLIMLYDVNTHQTQSIEQPGASNVGWFPNGTELIFQAPDASGINQLYRIRTDGTGRQQITNNTAGPLHDVRLSPDGMFAVYTIPGASISIIHTVELSSGRDFEIEGGPLAKNYNPEWSPDSGRIAYSATASDVSGYYSQVRTVGRKGEEDRIWAISNCFATPVTWSPDGSKLAYLSGCREQEFASELWVLEFSNPVPVRVIAGVNIANLQWSGRPYLWSWVSYSLSQVLS